METTEADDSAREPFPFRSYTARRTGQMPLLIVLNLPSQLRQLNFSS